MYIDKVLSRTWNYFSIILSRYQLNDQSNSNKFNSKRIHGYLFIELQIEKKIYL